MKLARLLHFLLLVSFILGACAPAAIPETPAPVEPTDVPDTPTAAPTASPKYVDECLACHTDQEKLTLLAVPEVAHEAESKGVG